MTYQKWVDGVLQADFDLEFDVRVELITFHAKFLINRHDDF